MNQAVILLVRELVGKLQAKNEVRENFMTVSTNHRETFKVRVESPEILVLKLTKPGSARVTLLRPDSASSAAHMEGVIKHLRAEEVLYSRTYRSDKGGYANTFEVQENDHLVITLEAHHFVSAVVGQGSTEMDVEVLYGAAA